MVYENKIPFNGLIISSAKHNYFIGLYAQFNDIRMLISSKLNTFLYSSTHNVNKTIFVFAYMKTCSTIQKLNTKAICTCQFSYNNFMKFDI